MSPSEQANAILTELNFRTQEYFIGGSGPMALRDMRHLGDLDIGVTTEYWFELLNAGGWKVYTPPAASPKERCDPPFLHKRVQGIQVHVFFAWKLRSFLRSVDSDYNEIFRSHVERLWREGFSRAWPCVRLGLLLQLKTQAQREKDLPDIAAIAGRIQEEGRS